MGTGPVHNVYGTMATVIPYVRIRTLATVLRAWLIVRRS
jgi:hypothetical protein